MISEEGKLNKQQLLAFFAMIIGMFMAILDIQIVASSLSVIGAGLSATRDELSWIQTSYMIAEVIIIPISGFLANLFSTRIVYFISALGFTIMSILCSLAWNINAMIIFRALQGFFGGAMIPLTFASIFLLFSAKQRSQVSVLIGLVVTVAPTLGPIIGGYLTEKISWHFMFLVNFLPGLFVCIATWLYADFDKPNYSLLNNFDYIGIILLGVSLGCLEYVLEEGNHKGWFDSTLIIVLTIITVASFTALFINELTRKNPILDLSAFRNINFSIGTAYCFVMGIGLFGVVYLTPLFLSSVPQMTTLQIGSIMTITGIAQFLSAPIAGPLSAKLDQRILLVFGFSLFSLGCYLNSNLTVDSGFFEFLCPQALRGFALMFCFIPINNIALGNLPKTQVQRASSLYSLIRNLGGAIGLAIISSNITNNSKIYSAYLSENITSTSLHYNFELPKIISLFNNGTIDNEKTALTLWQQLIQRDAFTLSINNLFIFLSILFILCLCFLPIIRNSKTQETGH